MARFHITTAIQNIGYKVYFIFEQAACHNRLHARMAQAGACQVASCGYQRASLCYHHNAGIA